MKTFLAIKINALIVCFWLVLMKMKVKLAIKNSFLSNDLEPLVVVQDIVQASSLNETLVFAKLEQTI